MENMVKVNLPGKLMKIITLSETLINYSSLRENLYNQTQYSHKQSILAINTINQNNTQLNKINKENNNEIKEAQNKYPKENLKKTRENQHTINQ